MCPRIRLVSRLFPIISITAIFLALPAYALGIGLQSGKPEGRLHLAPAKILGKDTRSAVPKELRSIAAGIGLLNGKGFGGCTAFCVQARVIATNAHCLIGNNQRGKSAPLNDWLFFIRTGPGKAEMSRLYYADPKQPALSVVSGWWRPEGTISTQETDWALAKLTNPICDGRELFLGQPNGSGKSARQSEGKALLIGYHSDSRTIDDIKLSADCSFDRKSVRSGLSMNGRRLVEHNCDTKQGSSGAPLLIKIDGLYRAFAINTGSLSYRRYQKFSNGRTKTLSRTESNVAVPVEAFSDRIARFAGEDAIWSLGELEQVQTLLQAGGHYKGKIDRTYGPATRSAIFAFERKAGLAPLGIPTKQMLQQLQRSYASTASSN